MNKKELQYYSSAAMYGYKVYTFECDVIICSIKVPTQQHLR